MFFLFKNIKTKCVFVCFLLLLFQFIAISEATAKTPGWIKDIGRNIKENAKRQVHNNEILTDCTARLIQASSRSEVMRIWSMYKGIDINMFVPNQKYELPIFVCVGMVNHSSDAVAAVLSLGARVNAIINNQFPSLYYVLAANDSPAVIEAFLRAGANANSNINGITPLLFAAAKKVSPEIIRVLIKYGARDANLEAAVANSQRSTSSGEMICPSCQGQGITKLFEGTSSGFNKKWCEQCNGYDAPHTHGRCPTCNGIGKISR